MFAGFSFNSSRNSGLAVDCMTCLDISGHFTPHNLQTSWPSLIPSSSIRPLSLMFLPSAPQNHQIRPRSDIGVGDITGIIGIVFGAAAFFFALYQFRFNIFVSGKLRDKCSAGAIGGWNRFLKIRNRIAWKRPILVQFPLIKFNVFEVLRFRNNASVIEQPMLVRASWSNMLSCLDITPTDELISGYCSADTIPSNLDTPYLNPSLNDIGIYCYLLGMKNVQLDVVNVAILARNSHASITTREIPGVGNVVSLDGDLPELWKKYVHSRSTDELIETANWVNGYLPFKKFKALPYAFKPLNLIFALQNEWEEKIWEIHEGIERRRKHGLQPGDLVWEADQHSQQHSETWSEFWKSKQAGACPSILQVLAFLPFHHICAGFPLKLYLPYAHDLLPQFQRWWTQKPDSFCVADEQFQDQIEDGKLNGLNPTSSFCVVSELHGRSRSWLYNDWNELKPIFTGCPSMDTFDQLDQDANFKHPSPVFPIVGELLNHQDLTALLALTESKHLKFVRPYVTVEAALWLSLTMVDARIRVLWSAIPNQESKAVVYQGGFLAL